VSSPEAADVLAVLEAYKDHVIAGVPQALALSDAAVEAEAEADAAEMRARFCDPDG
jgi:hypothetical protein